MKKFLALISAALLLFATACSAAGEVQTASSQAEAQALGTYVEKETVESINDVTIQDNPLLYANDDPAEVRVFYLTVSRGNEGENTDHTWAEINTYSAYDYDDMGVDRYQVEGLLQVGDENGPIDGQFGYGINVPNATVQVRGQTSSGYRQKNYKVRLKDDVGTVEGQQTIALNKHWGDPLRIRNKLMYDLIAQVPDMMGLRTHFVHLYVRDNTQGTSTAFSDYGLYTWVEQLNKTAMNAHGQDRNGQLYKINSCEFYRYEDVIKLKTDPTYDLDAFEVRLEVKGNDDHTKLIEMLEAVNDYSRPIEDVCAAYFDMDNMLTWMAFHILTGNVDTQNRNVYIYSPLNGEKWYFWSWDNDGSFNLLNEEIRAGITDRGWEKGISNYWGNVLFQRVLKVDRYRDMLDTKIQNLYTGVLAPDHVQQMSEEYAAITTPYVYSMPDVEYAPLTRSQHDEVLANMGNEVIRNYEDYKEDLDCPMPFFIGTPIPAETGYTCAWDPAYDLEGRSITYTAEIANSLSFSESSIVASYTGPLLLIEIPELSQGQYFIRVYATNTDGKSQPGFDYYVTENSRKVFGTKCFYVMDDGSVEEFLYEEG